MTKSIKEQLGLNQECEDILNCLYDIRELDKKCYKYLLDNSEDTTVDELSDKMNRDVSTIHRSLNRLIDADLIIKERKSGEMGGYKHIYFSRDTDEVEEEMKILLHDWYVKTSKLVTEFSSKYN